MRHSKLHKNNKINEELRNNVNLVLPWKNVSEEQTAIETTLPAT